MLIRDVLFFFFPFSFFELEFIFAVSFSLVVLEELLGLGRGHTAYKKVVPNLRSAY